MFPIKPGLLMIVMALWPLAMVQAQTPYAGVADGASFDAVQALPVRSADARLTYGNDANQYGLLWLPAEAEPVRALLVFVHGGCWLNSFSVDHGAALATALAARGYAVWAPEYRRVGDAGGGWPGSLEDIVASVATVRGTAEAELSARPYGLMGHSAGGHLALLAAAELARTDANPAQVISLAGITDLPRYGRGQGSCNQAVSQFMQGSPAERAEAYVQANPAEQPLPANTWVLHGDADTIVPLDQADLSGAHQRVVAGAGHFDWIHPGSRAFALLLSVLELSF